MSSLSMTGAAAMPLKAGLYYGMPFTEYLAVPAVSRSRLWASRRSPAHGLVTQEGTEAMAFGTLVDNLVLDPHAASRYSVFPKVDGRTKAGKLANDAKRLMACNGVVPVDEDDWQRAQMIVGALNASSTARPMLAGERQVSVIWRDEETGCWCKARPDVLALSLGAIVDLKTTEDASLDSFRWSVRRYGYHVQAAFYLDGLRANGVTVDKAAIVAVEKSAPFAVACYELAQDVIDEGRETYRPLLATYAACCESNQWPGYPGLQLLSFAR